MAIITGVGGTGSVGMLSIQGQIIVSLLSDDAGAPSSLIAVLGVFTDADLVLGTNLLEIILDAPIALVPNTRYWIQVAGNRTTSFSWVQAADDDGLGIADEFWYENASGTITSGANADGPSFEMAVLSEPSTGVSATAEVGSLTDAIVTAPFGVEATDAVGSVQPIVEVMPIDLAAVGEVGDVTPSRDTVGQPRGVAGTGLVGAVAIPGKLVVSLLSDSAGSPASLIAVLGVYEDADLSLGTILLEIDLSSAPIALTPNTRYWIEVSGNSFTSFSWVEAADPGGAGVATELWYHDVNGTISSGANSAGPSFQMEVLAEPPTGVYGTADAGALGVKVGGVISGVQTTGAVGTVFVPGTIKQPINGVLAEGQCGSLSDLIAVLTSGAEASGQAGTATATEALQTLVEGVTASGTCGSFGIVEAATTSGASSTGQVGSLTTTSFTSILAIPIGGVEAIGSAGIARGSKRKLRGGRGGKEHFTPHLFAKPDRETAAEALARWRRAVDDLLLDRKPEDDQPAPDPYHADFEFLNSLPLTVVDEPIAGPVEMVDWEAIAEAEDMLLLGETDLLEDEELAFDLL